MRQLVPSWLVRVALPPVCVAAFALSVPAAPPEPVLNSNFNLTSISENEASTSMVIDPILRESEKLPAARRDLLDAAAKEILAAKSDGRVALVAVCTHNSRRSQFAQAWCEVAVDHYKMSGLDCYSCGTEATACNPRTIAALERSGWLVERPTATESNPRYKCTLGNAPSVTLWSKAFGDESLPTKQIVAMMCCDEADQACPHVPGAVARIPLHYVDPKVSDSTAQESPNYDQRCNQIAAEMFYLVRQLR